jgi:predicted Rossmann fold nucleotide-binding protein DprA/Smf involved in DNA uptake
VEPSLTRGTLPLPDLARSRFSEPTPVTLAFLGPVEWLHGPLLGLLCSRECPGNAILATLDQAPEWVKAGQIVISGFHSPLEQQIFRSLLRRSGRAVKVLARTLEGYRVPPLERTALDAGHLLLISPFPAEVRRTTRQTALDRNRLVIALASELAIPHVREHSPLAELLKAARMNS